MGGLVGLAGVDELGSLRTQDSDEQIFREGLTGQSGQQD